MIFRIFLVKNLCSISFKNPCFFMWKTVKNSHFQGLSNVDKVVEMWISRCFLLKKTVTFCLKKGGVKNSVEFFTPPLGDMKNLIMH